MSELPMSFPAGPCESCPRLARSLPMPCLAMTTRHARLCELAARGDAAYIALICDEPSAPAFPLLATQAVNLAGAVGRFVASGGELTTAEERERRLSICRGCENFADGRCRLCGCFLSAKIASAAEHCPLGPPRW